MPILGGLLWFTALMAWFGQDPFYGDGTSTLARGTMDIFENGLIRPWYSAEHDPGHPTLIPWLLAAIWKITGHPTLWTAHALNLLFGLGTLAGLWTWSRLRQINPWIPSLLLAISPTFVSQCALLITHLPLTCCFVWALVALESEQKERLAILCSLLVLIHLEGVFLVSSLALAAVLRYSKPYNLKSFFSLCRPFIPAWLTFILWGYLHQQHAGWAFSSPNYADHRFTPSLGGVLTHIAIIGWRLIDVGYITAYVWLVSVCVLAIKRKNYPSLKPLLHFSLALGFVVVAVAVTVNFHAGHRYFFPFTPWLFLLVGQYAKEFRHSISWLSAIAISLLLGHWIYYPGKTMGDATLAYRGWFNVKHQLEEKFPGKVFYTYAPIANPPKYTSLSPEKVAFEGLYETPIDSANWVLVSNLNGEFTSTQLDTLSHWPCTSFESGWVWATVYVRPGTSGVDTAGWKSRQPGIFERWMIKMKSQIAP